MSGLGSARLSVAAALEGALESTLESTPEHTSEDTPESTANSTPENTTARASGPASFASRLSFEEFLLAWHGVDGRGVPQHWHSMARWMECMAARGERRLVMQAFRAAGKSTLGGFFAAWLLFRSPSLRILIVAAEQSLATRMALHTRGILERHPLTRHLVAGRRDVWASDRFTVERAGGGRDPSLLARGLESNLTGSRADVIVCDDVEVPNTARSYDLRMGLRRRLSELDFVLVPGGLALYLGTPHAEDSIYATDYALDGSAPFLEGAARFSLPVRDGSGRPTWPGRYSRSGLERLLERSGSRKFSSQMLLQPASENESGFNTRQLALYDDELEYREGGGEAVLELCGRRMVSSACRWDPALGPAPGRDGRKRDSNALALLYQDVEGQWYLHRLLYLPPPPADGTEDAAQWYCGRVADLVAAFHVPSVSVETNGLGAFLPGLLRRKLALNFLRCTVVEAHTKSRKADRIVAALDPLLSARALSVHRSVMSTPFPRELRSWDPQSQGLSDDGLDAVASAVLLDSVRLSRLPLGVRLRAAQGGMRIHTGDPMMPLPGRVLPDDF